MKKGGKFLGVLLAVCMVITMNVVSAYADSSVPVTRWDNYAATKFAGGTGTKDDPYRIENGEQLVDQISRNLLPYNAEKQPIYLLLKNGEKITLENSENQILSSYINQPNTKYILSFPREIL